MNNYRKMASSFTSQKFTRRNISVILSKFRHLVMYVTILLVGLSVLLVFQLPEKKKENRIILDTK